MTRDEKLAYLKRKLNRDLVLLERTYLQPDPNERYPYPRPKPSPRCRFILEYSDGSNMATIGLFDTHEQAIDYAERTPEMGMQWHIRTITIVNGNLGK
jgi:hypothetical protein